MSRRSMFTPAMTRFVSRLRKFSTLHRSYQVMILVAAALFLFLLALWLVPLPDRVRADYSVTVYSHEGALLRPYLAPGDVWRFPVRLSELPPFVIPALLAREDKRFYSHFGVDPVALLRAMLQNVRSGHVVSGGSTITMQLARLLEPRPRTLGSKLIEAFRATQLEMHLSKDEILRLYLSYAPYGGNIEGISTASYVYFGHGPAEITPGEMAVLLLLPQSPSRWRHFDEEDWRRARAQVLDELLQKQVINQRQHDTGIQGAVPHERLPLPLRAPHLADYLRQQFVDEVRIRSTLSVDVQRMVERVVSRVRPKYQALGAYNMTVLVVENSSRKLRAAVGNFDYLDHQHGQGFAAFTVPRSPGSTLKPFLYALAIEQGKILPQTLLLDVPTQYGAYEPGNFSGQYLGLTTAEHALSQSLNIPFVRLLQDVGMDYFLEYLEQGTSWKFDRDLGLGLSMIIGGVELTPLQMLELYVNLAAHGRAGTIRMLERDGEEAAQSKPWLSEGSVALLEQALASRDRPDFPGRKDLSRFNPDIRWKTGTSQGRRDAWSIGYDNRYTVLVWVGNMDQAPSQFLTGAMAAAPVMFEILEGLQSQKGVAEIRGTSTSELEEVEVCAFSGDAPSSYCPLKRTVKALKGKRPAGSCRFHQQVLLDKKSGLRVLKGCDDNMKTRYASVLRLPSSVRRWYGERYGAELMMPPFHPGCKTLITEQGALTILNPKQGEEFMMLPSFGRKNVVIVPDIESSSGMNETSCFLNGSQLQKPERGEHMVLTLPAGDYHLFCSNIHGASDEVAFSIKAVK